MKQMIHHLNRGVATLAAVVLVSATPGPWLGQAWGVIGAQSRGSATAGVIAGSRAGSFNAALSHSGVSGVALVPMSLSITQRGGLGGAWTRGLPDKLGHAASHLLEVGSLSLPLRLGRFYGAAYTGEGGDPSGGRGGPVAAVEGGNIRPGSALEGILEYGPRTGRLESMKEDTQLRESSEKIFLLSAGLAQGPPPILAVNSIAAQKASTLSRLGINTIPDTSGGMPLQAEAIFQGLSLQDRTKSNIVQWGEWFNADPKDRGRILRRLYEPLLAEMINSLGLAVSKMKFDAGFSSGPRFAKEVLHYLFQKSEGEELTREEILELAFLYSVAIGSQMQSPLPITGIGDVMVQTIEQILMLFKGLEFTKPFITVMATKSILPIPTFENLTFRSFLELADYPIYYFGLISIPRHPVNRYSATTSYLHDYSHNIGMLKRNPFLESNITALQGIQREFISQNRKVEQLFTEAQSESSTHAKIVLRLLFYFKHEHPGIYRLDWPNIKQDIKQAFRSQYQPKPGLAIMDAGELGLGLTPAQRTEENIIKALVWLESRL